MKYKLLVVSVFILVVVFFYASSLLGGSITFVSEPSVAKDGNVAEEDISSGNVETLTSSGSDLELTSDSAEGKKQIVGIRFPNVTVPQGAFIISASIQFQSDENQNGTTTIRFYGEYSDNSSLFKTETGNISLRSKTITSVDWEPEDWSIGDSNNMQKTPNLWIIVQEIVIRQGWTSGNAMTFLVASNTFPNHRTAENGVTNGPILTIEYDTSISVFISERAVAKEGNVAEEDVVSGSVETLNSSGSDLELTSDLNEGKEQIVGIRFPNVQVPKKATIHGAIILFQSDENQSGPVTITFYGEAVDNSSLFQEINGNVSNRAKTSNSRDWNPNDWDIGDSGNAQITPDLMSIVQEIVNRPGWSFGNAMSFLLTSNNFPNHRTAENGINNGPIFAIAFENNSCKFVSERAVAKDGNIAEENSSSGIVETRSSAGSDLELTSDSAESKQQIVGIRFPKIDIPQGATIKDAYIQFESDENQNGPVTISFYGEASDNSLLFNENIGNVSNRQKTSALVNWIPNNWNIRDKGLAQKTPNLAQIVQEIVDRPNWVSGNAIAFIVLSNDFPNHRTAENGSSNGPVLYIKTQSLDMKVHGLNFSPYIDGQDPNLGDPISEKQLRERMEIIAPYTERIRTFSVDKGLELAGRIANELGLAAAIGAWIGTDLVANDNQISDLIKIGKANEAELLIVGSEALLRNDVTEKQLLEYINRVKQKVPGIPVTYADVHSIMLSHPAIIDAVDVVMVNYYPYWEGIDVLRAIETIHGLHKQVVVAANGKKVIVSETGWPSAGNLVGNAVPSLENAVFHFRNFVSWASTNNVEYYYFEAFDETWKSSYEGPQGAHWGVWDKEGNLKDGMEAVFYCQGTPTIEFTNVPPLGSFSNLQGQVRYVNPNEFKVAVYIYVSGWWTKPTFASPLTNIRNDGSFTTDITTGGFDQTATRIIAYLVPNGYNPPAMSGGRELPKEIDTNSVAKIEVAR